MNTKLILLITIVFIAFNTNAQVFTVSNGVAKTDKVITVDNPNTSHSTFRIGHQINDAIIADNSDNNYYGGGFFFRVHDETVAS